MKNAYDVNLLVKDIMAYIVTVLTPTQRWKFDKVLFFLCVFVVLILGCHAAFCFGLISYPHPSICQGIDRFKKAVKDVQGKKLSGQVILLSLHFSSVLLLIIFCK